jgi:hypothetical protein
MRTSQLSERDRAVLAGEEGPAADGFAALEIGQRVTIDASATIKVPLSRWPGQHTSIV